MIDYNNPTPEQSRYLLRKARLHASGVTANGKPWSTINALSFAEDLISSGLPLRFWAKCHKTESGCWNWTAGKNRSGYGKESVGERSGLGAHRIAFLLERGAIPKDMLVCHSCDNPACVNPAHLWLGTSNDNMQDKVRKGRQAKGETIAAKLRGRSVPHATGSRQWSAKLTEAQIPEIRRLYATGMNRGELAAQFGICKQNLHDIATRRSWKQVP